MDSDSIFNNPVQPLSVKRNFKSPNLKSNFLQKEDSVFLGEENLAKVQNFQK